MAQAAGALAELALAVIEALGRRGTPTPVSLTGGVAAAGAPLLDPFRRWLALTAPAAALTAPKLSPLEGAALLALHHFGKRRK